MESKVCFYVYLYKFIDWIEKKMSIFRVLQIKDFNNMSEDFYNFIFVVCDGDQWQQEKCKSIVSRVQWLPLFDQLVQRSLWLCNNRVVHNRDRKWIYHVRRDDRCGNILCKNGPCWTIRPVPHGPLRPNVLIWKKLINVGQTWVDLNNRT